MIEFTKGMYGDTLTFYNLLAPRCPVIYFDTCGHLNQEGQSECNCNHAFKDSNP